MSCLEVKGGGAQAEGLPGAKCGDMKLHVPSLAVVAGGPRVGCEVGIMKDEVRDVSRGWIMGGLRRMIRKLELGPKGDRGH